MSITEWLLETGVHMIDKAGYVGAAAALIVDSCGVPIPSEAVLALAGSVAKTGDFNLITVLIIGTIAQTIGAYIAYMIGKYGGEPVLKKYGKYVLISVEDYEKAHAWLEKRGDKAVFASRLIPVIRTYSGFAAGAFHMDQKRFVRDTFAGSALWTLVFVMFGYWVGDSWRNYIKYFHVVDYVVIVLILAVVAHFGYRKYKSRKNA